MVPAPSSPRLPPPPERAPAETGDPAGSGETASRRVGLSLRARLALWVLLVMTARLSFIIAVIEYIYDLRFDLGMTGVMAAGTGIAVAVAWWLAGRSLRPLATLAEEMGRISAGRLDLRLPEPPGPPHDEVRRVVAAFNAMLDRLHRSVELTRQFTHDAAHELRTPVAAVMTAIEVALRRERSAEQYRAVLDKLLPAMRQLADLGRDMGTLADADAGRLTLEIDEADINEVVGLTAEFLEPLAEERGLSLVFRRSPLPWFRGDPSRLRQVFFNLVENAVKYTPAGGTVRVYVGGDAETVRVRVADTGPGIPPEHLGRLFDRFYRVDPHRNRKTGGSGLGLAIVRSLVTAHGGTVSVESAVGKGTTFMVTLPRGLSLETVLGIGTEAEDSESDYPELELAPNGTLVPAPARRTATTRATGGPAPVPATVPSPATADGKPLPDETATTATTAAAAGPSVPPAPTAGVATAAGWTGPLFTVEQFTAELSRTFGRE